MFFVIVAVVIALTAVGAQWQFMRKAEEGLGIVLGKAAQAVLDFCRAVVAEMKKK